MFEIAIVEDEEVHAVTLEQYLLRFAEEHATAFHITHFKNAITLLEGYSALYHVIFMDIRMPYLNGMAASEKLRELDEKVILIFVTSLTQYAVQGYDVGALAYIVKPITYPDFALKFTRAFKRLKQTEETAIFVPTERGTAKLYPAEIAFCEVMKHTTVFHTTQGNYEQNATLRSVEEILAPQGFAKCNHCYLVNLRYVKRISAENVDVDCNGRTYVLAISRNKRKPFYTAWEEYRSGRFGGGKQ